MSDLSLNRSIRNTSQRESFLNLKQKSRAKLPILPGRYSPLGMRQQSSRISNHNLPPHLQELQTLDKPSSINIKHPRDKLNLFSPKNNNGQQEHLTLE